MTKRIEAPDGYEYFSSKTFDHNVGLSCCFRQWRAKDSHCRFLHGYALKVKLEFSAYALDDRNWVMDFGGFEDLKDFLKETFDHKCVVASDDPELGTIMSLETRGLVQLVILPDVGCEFFAKAIFENCLHWLQGYNKQHNTSVYMRGVEVSEHTGNSAGYRRKP